MGNFFANIYLYFNQRRKLLFAIMILLFAIMGALACRIHLNEDIVSFMPNSANNKNIHLVFNNLKSADRIFVMFNNSPVGAENPDSLIAVSGDFCRQLQESVAGELITEMGSMAGETDIREVTGFIYNHLPIFLKESDYKQLEKRLNTDSIENRMQENYNMLISPQGFVMRDMILHDPLGMANGILLKTKELGGGINCLLYDGQIFSQDMRTLLITITPKHKMSETGANRPLVEELEKLAQKYDAQYFGGPSVAVHNAESIKRDTYVTTSIAMLILALVITMAFKNKYAILLMGLPVLFGGLFGLSLIYLIKGSISAIAIGTGTAVFGIAMSYAIHVIAHQNHTSSITQIIKELAYPLTIGSFTTIGAFLGLLLTSSSLLRDFGLFAALSLIGTTLFCLVFLPHLLTSTNRKGTRLLHCIDRITGYNYHNNKWIVSILVIMSVVALFNYNNVKFNSNMLDLSITPAHIKEAEEMLAEKFSTKESIFFIASHSNPDSAAEANANAAKRLAELKERGIIKDFVSLQDFILPSGIQKQRIERWKHFWADKDIAAIKHTADAAAVKAGFRAGTFSNFFNSIENICSPIAPDSQEICSLPLFKESISSAVSPTGEKNTLIITRVEIPQQNKDIAYKAFEADSNITVADKSFFAGKMAESINTDFTTALLVSSVLIFIALLVSYGRIELALLAFCPMAIAWVIILGIMAICNIEFNIINIILSTFVFGIGDDFSIFIMDGLLREYKTGEKTLPAHKTAIFFSAFSTIIGIGSLIFASHPALKSIALVSIIGMSAVVLVSFTVQPVLFNILIRKPARKGGFPYTLLGILNTLYAFTYFLVACILLQAVILVLLVIPYNKEKKKTFFHALVSKACRIFLHTMFTVKVKEFNPHSEDFSKPAVIIANHQSFIDILMILSLCRKCIMITNGWVWRSPVFGWIIRYADFYHTDNGYEYLAEKIRPSIEKGYSVVIFPEGTRSADNSIHKFRKGAFYLAELMQMDILPILLYGNGHISSKSQPFYIKKGIIASQILQRIPPGTMPYKDVAKRCRAMFEREYEKLYNRLATGENSYFYNSVIKNYTYMEPVVEWYMRIKVKMEKNYAVFDALIPKECKITDLGCGYGPADFMLSLLGPKRIITGIDYDKEKIDTARNSLLTRDAWGNRKENLNFICADAMEYPLEYSDVFLINDMLHYLTPENQTRLVANCINRLNKGGLIIIRDGDSNKKERQKITALTEKLSTAIFHFNKAECGLHFNCQDNIYNIAKKYGMDVKSIDNDSITSNTIYLLSNPQI